MMKKVSLESSMSAILMLLAFFIPISTAAASILIGLGAIFIIMWSIRAKKAPEFDSNVLEVLSVYLVLEIFIAASSWEPMTSFREVFGEFHRFFPLIFAMTFIKKREQLIGVLIASLIAFLINDLAGIWQYFIKNEPRAFGFNHTPTFYGSFMLIQLPILIFIAKMEIMPSIWRLTAVFGAILSVICLILSMTRGAWLAFVIVAVIFFVLEKKYRRMLAKIFAGLAIMFLIVAICSPRVHERLETLTNMQFQSNSERILMWKSAIEMFKDYPLFGVGQKMFFRAYNEKYIAPEAKERPGEIGLGHTHPHNNFLKVLSEGGIVGLGAFIGLYAYFFWKFYVQREREGKLALSGGLIAILILSGLQIEGLTDTNMNQVPIMREFWLLAGILIASERILKEK